MGDFGDEGSRGGEETGVLGEVLDIEGRRTSLSGVSCWKIDDRLRPFCSGLPLEDIVSAEKDDGISMLASVTWSSEVRVAIT